MNRGIFAKSLVAVLAATCITGCAFIQDISSAFSSGKNKGPTKVNNLVGAIERVYVDSELAKEKANAALGTLQTIAKADFGGDAVTAFARFMEAIEASEKQADKLRSSSASMKKASEPVFEQWAENVLAIQNADMRLRSHNRLEATRRRYDAIVETVDPAQAACDAFNASLRDHALYLSNDLNRAALAEIRDEVRSLASSAAQLDNKVNACLVASRTYVDSAALPVTSGPGESTGTAATAVSGSSTTQKSTKPRLVGSARSEG